MAHKQLVADVHLDEMCPLNKRYDLMDANKKIDLEHVQCPPESKILTNIIKNHPLRFSIAASYSVPWIYMVQFWHTLKEDGLKYRLKFMLDRKELSLTLDDFKTIFYLPQATKNNHDRFVPPPSFYDMITFCRNHLGFTMELKTPSSFKTTGLLQPFTKIIIGHYMTNFPEISRRARDKYHNLKDDDLMKNIFNLGKYKDKVGMKIPDWMITNAMKQTKHYRMYAEVFGIDVPLIQSPPTESTHRTHRTPSAPRSTRLTPPTLVLTVDKADELILQDTLQVSLAKHKSRQEQEVRENVALVDEHLASVEIEKMVEGQENVVDDSSISRNDEHYILGTRLEPMSNNKSPEVGITDVIVPVNVYDEEEEGDEITDDVYELKRREKGKNVEESRITPFATPIRSPRIYTDHELQGRYGYLFEHLRAKFMPRKSFVTLADHLHEAMADSLPTMAKEQKEMKKMIAKAILQERGNIQAQISSQIQQAISNDIPSQFDATPAVLLRDQDDPHDDAHPKGEKSTKRQKTSKYETYVSGESSSGQDNEQEQGPSTSGNKEQADDYDFWTDSYTSNDDEILTKQVSQDIMEEVSLNVDEAKLKKTADEMLRQRCTSGDEHQYHIDQMKNLLKSNIVRESRNEILVSPHPRKTTPLVISCQRDPEALALSLINQDLLYLKKGNSKPEKILLSLNKFHAVVFNDDDIEERTSRWVNKCVKKFNPYAQYGVEHWKNPHAKIFYIKKQKEPRKPKEIIAKRANECIVLITEPDFKNLNKNDIEDMYLLIMNGKVLNYAETGLLCSLSVFIKNLVIWERVHDFQLGIKIYQHKVNLTALTIYFPKIKKHEMLSIIYEPVHGIIYKNSKKEKRVMRHSEIHKYCDATLNRVLECLKSYNNDVRYGYNQRDLTKDEVKYLKLFEEEIEDRLKYRRQMRR
nr:hypothetical protein [Tanacetum cinerariifolium]